MEIQGKMKVYCPKPFVAGQRRDRSDINGRTNPQAFWNEPGERPIILLKAPPQVVKQLRDRASWHFGYDRDSKSDIDKGLIKAMKLPATQLKIMELRQWAKVLQWEVASMRDEAVTVAWHPALTADLLRQATTDPVYAIEAETYDEALTKWKEARGEIRFVHAFRFGGWHNYGFWCMLGGCLFDCQARCHCGGQRQRHRAR